jgi:C4-dicarboxylate transporter DctM subunit
MIVLMPILMPIAVHHGIHPIHFIILVQANVAVGFISPPVGTVLFTACAISRLPMERVIRPLLPFIFVLVAVMFAITYVAGITMWLPRLLGYA